MEKSLTICDEITEAFHLFNRTCTEVGGKIDCSKKAYPFRLEPICHAEGKSINQCWYARETAIILYIFLTIILLREIQELMVSGPWLYFTSKENLLQDLIIVLTVSFIVVAPINTEVGTHLAAWAVFFAWVSFPKFYRNFILYKK